MEIIVLWSIRVIALFVISSLFIILLINRFQYLRLVTLCVSLLLIVGITFVSPTVKKRMVDATFEQVGVSSD